MSWAPGNSRDPPAVIGAYDKRRRHPPVHDPWTSRRDDDLLPRMVAAAATLALLAMAAKLLLGPPRALRAAAADPSRVQLVFVARPPAAGPALPPEASPPEPTVRDIGASPPPRGPEAAARPGTQDRARPAATRPAAGGPLYDADGRVRLPADDRWSAADGLATPAAEDAAARVLQPRNPVEVRSTRFAKDWISDGDAADVVQQQIMRAQRKIAEFLFGKDIKHATARPSPDVRFNPARHERDADLGSEATGDAYKAAPISYQPAPGLDGTASRRIREQVAALEAAYGRCDRKRLERLMQPLLLHLDELQKVEAAKAAGADPIRAEHMLPNAANSAYDLARRALWHADDRMAAACAG